MITYNPITLGADPEIFFEKSGKILGAEKIIPSEGLGDNNYGLGGVVLDGVQAELHPPATYRANVILNLRRIFTQLKNHLDGIPNVKICMAEMVEITKQELDSLGEEARLLNCKPSMNIYGIKKAEVDGSKYRKRSASGHIHMTPSGAIFGRKHDNRLRLVPILDIILGNTCVMIDRDPAQVERRKLYGRVGEYRLPLYGLEYRTLSNFWLRSPILADFVFSMAEMADNIVMTSMNNAGKGVDEDPEVELLELVDFRKLIRAVNGNDYNLAKENWSKVRDFIYKHSNLQHPIHKDNIHKFDKFLDMIDKNGLESIFSSDMSTVMNQWLTPAASPAAQPCWQSFLVSF